jgi:hypothetical protein
MSHWCNMSKFDENYKCVGVGGAHAPDGSFMDHVTGTHTWETLIMVRVKVQVSRLLSP